ncbi:MAG: ATP-grasp domain-containing protein [Deltaproteobacteria bacterium]|nr:MAG: ATP-grasp domain-containing protein [Deltaproteobacteria bacterium]
MGPRVVELAGLADHDRPRPDDQDRFEIGAPRHRRTCTTTRPLDQLPPPAGDRRRRAAPRQLRDRSASDARCDLRPAAGCRFVTGGREESATVGFPLLVDQFLADAVELDVDVVADHTGAVIVGGVMEHIEEAGIHSGDSACALPPYSLPADIVDEVKRQARVLATELGVVGLMNTQFAIHGGDVYVLEVNPRASRTVPFVSKAIGRPLAKIAAKVMTGRTLAELAAFPSGEIEPRHVSVKEVVFPFVKFEGVDTILGPEMRSTGEVMGIDTDFARAFMKSWIASGGRVPTHGTAFLSVRDADKPALVEIARRLVNLGFSLVATHGTAAYLAAAGLPVRGINKVLEGRPDCVDAMDNREIELVINTTEGTQAIQDSVSLRRAALMNGIAYQTTLRGARAALEAIAVAKRGDIRVASLQTYARP